MSSIVLGFFDRFNSLLGFIPKKKKVVDNEGAIKFNHKSGSADSFTFTTGAK